MKTATIAAPAESAANEFLTAKTADVSPRPAAVPTVSRPGVVADFADLVKARLTTLVLATTLTGFYLGWNGGDVPFWLAAINALLGTALVAAGSAALNQLLERELDARMRRTLDRPLPAGRLRPDHALLIGFALALGGLLYLAFLVNLLTAMLAALTLGIYLFVYTPLKRITTLNTLVGAIPGALPPLLGWTAARGALGAGGWALFGILFFWQMPHFLAIAWMYRDDYARGGFVMLPNVDPDGRRTGWQSVNYSFGLLLVSLMPTLLGLNTAVYFFGALALGAGMIFYSLRLLRDRTRPHARQLFLASVIYLPLLLILLAATKAT
ncbi:MAG: protoheme IX farnesyltransferase [Verrucomicrobia bacterium]|nr:protoheme IX farnesyltransferase [Verrucomicrobiota bacterium]